MFLFILESIGTSELLLIGLIALIVFGPRKLPQMAKTIGKTMAEFKRAGQEFRTTWEKEVTLEEQEKNFFKDPFNENNETQNLPELTYNENTQARENNILPPEIKEVSGADFPAKAETEIQERKENAPVPAASKQDWL